MMNIVALPKRWMASLAAATVFSAVLITPVRAAAPTNVPAAVAQATAIVICGDRQGSGVLLAGGRNYLLTAGHVVIDVDTREPATACDVGFAAAPDWQPRAFFQARVVFAVYDDRVDRDFAMLKIVDHLSGPTALPSGLVVSEAAQVGDAVSFSGYPVGANNGLETSEGKVIGFRRGTVRSDAVIEAGYSGGPMTDAVGRLVGLAARLILVKDTLGQEVPQDYEGVDILGLENWLDTNRDGHDNYLTHADWNLAHGPTPLYREEEPPCSYLVRLLDNPAVYCLLPGSRRLAFPTQDNYYSWYPDFSQVKYVTAENLAEYQLVANMTFQAGTLIKVRTDPKVYFVADDIGTIRWVTSASVAERLFGAGWAGQVHDVPDEFFLDYKIGHPLE